MLNLIKTFKFVVPVFHFTFWYIAIADIYVYLCPIFLILQRLSIRILPNNKLLVHVRFQNIVFEWLTINDQTGKAKELRETAMSGRSVSSQRHAHV